MRHVVVGSFVGFVLAAAFLAACGSAGDNGPPAGPAPVSTPSAVKWTALGPRDIVVTGVNLSTGSSWGSTSIVENAGASRRFQYAAFQIEANVESFGTSEVTVDVGILPSVDGNTFAVDPQWLDSATLRVAANRRAVLSNVRIPPTRFKVALRLRAGAASATARITSLSMTPYSEELQ